MGNSEYLDKFYHYFYDDKIPEFARVNHQIEFLRKDLIVELRNKFKNVILSYDIFGENNYFRSISIIDYILSSWIFIQISNKKNPKKDPVIPNYPLDKNHDQQIVIDIGNKFLKKYPSMTKKEAEIKAKDIVKEVNFSEWTKKSLSSIESWLKKNNSDPRSEDLKTHFESDSVYFTIKSESIKIPATLYDRMKNLYIVNSSFGDINKLDINILNYLIFLVVYRYNYVEPNMIRQGAWPQELFDDLRILYNVNFDFTASAINSSVTKYCSLFYDLERFFGSRGNFFDIEPISGFYYSNPPGVEDITSKLIDFHIKSLKESDKPLTIILFIPPWELEEQPGRYLGTFNGLYRLRNSGFLTYENNPIGKKINTVKYYDYSKKKSFRAPLIVLLQNISGRENFDMTGIKYIDKKYFHK